MSALLKACKEQAIGTEEGILKNAWSESVTSKEGRDIAMLDFHCRGVPLSKRKCNDRPQRVRLRMSWRRRKPGLPTDNPGGSFGKAPRMSFVDGGKLLLPNQGMEPTRNKLRAAHARRLD